MGFLLAVGTGGGAGQLAELPDKMILIGVAQHFRDLRQRQLGPGDQQRLGIADPGIYQILHRGCTEHGFVNHVEPGVAHRCLLRNLCHSPLPFRLRKDKMPQIPQSFLFVMPDIRIIADALQRPGKGDEKFMNRMYDHLLPVGRIGKAFLLQLLYQPGNERGLFWKKQCVHRDVILGQFRSQIIYMEPVVQQRFIRVIPMGKTAFVKNAAARRNSSGLSANKKLHLGHKMQKCVFRVAVGTIDHKAGFFGQSCLTLPIFIYIT